MRPLRSGKIIIFFFISIIVLIPAFTFAKSIEAQKRVDRGNEFYKSAQYTEAISEYNAAVNLEPENILAWENLGWAYWRLGEEDSAFGIWDNLLKLQSDNTVAINRIASIYGNVFEYDKALQLYDKSITLKPKQKEAPIGIARVYLKMGELEKALDKTKEILKSYPHDEEVLRLEAAVLERLLKYEEAIKIWQELSAMQPSSIEYKMNIANNQFRAGQYKEAVKLAQGILREKPDDAGAIELLAEETLIRKDYSQAKEMLWEVAQRNPQDTAVLNRLSEIAALDKDYDMVIRATTLSLKANPAQYYEYLKRADAYLEEREYAKAMKDYNFALAQNPYDKNALVGKFWVYSNQGATKKALQVLKSIRSLLPQSDPQADFLFILMNMYSDNYSQAIKSLKNLQDALKQGVVTTLLYHGIGTNPDDPDNIFVGDFREQMKMLKAEGYNSITILELLEHEQKNKPLPSKPLIITFDDARKDSFTYGDPILKEFGFKATMFVPIVRVRTRPDVVLSFKELRKMFSSGRWDIQSHGLFAHDLVLVDPAGRREDFLVNKKWLFTKGRIENDKEFYARIRKDYKESKEVIEREIPGEKVVAYAFPRGNFGQLGSSNNPQAIDINLKLFKEFYKFGLYQNLYGQVILAKDNMFIQRYEVSPGTKAEDLKKYLRANELYYLSLSYLGESYISLRQYDKVEEILKQIPDKENNPQYYLLKGMEFREKGRLKQAQDAFQKATIFDKDNELAKKNMENLSVALKPVISPQYLHFSDNNNRVKDKYSMHFSQYLTEDLNFQAAYEKAFFHDKGFARAHENQAYLRLSYYPQPDKGVSLASKTRMFSTDKDVFAYQVLGESALTNKISAAFYNERDAVDTARAILAGIRYYRNKLYIDAQPTKSLSASFGYEHDWYSDTNRKDYASLLLMQRLRSKMPQLFVGYAYLWGDSKFDAPEYYTPVDLSINELHFKGVFNKGKLDFTQYCVIGYGRDTNVKGLAYSFTSTLRYNILKGFDFFGEFSLDRTPSYRSTQVTGGLEYRF